MTEWRKEKDTAKGDVLFRRNGVHSDVEAPPGFEPGIKDLQSHALPLGYGATSDLLRSNTNGFAVCFFRFANLPFSNRTRFYANSALRNLTGRAGLRFDSWVFTRLQRSGCPGQRTLFRGFWPLFVNSDCRKELL